MKFEKKYWSSGEFTIDAEGKIPYEGYVGIYDGSAYNFQTGEKLTALSSYLNRINTSAKNFDRTLSHKLKLPYGKNDISFAANDFLYGSTVKTIVEKLQKNNDYLFQNSIISNSILPYADKCVLYTSLYDENSAKPIKGKLVKRDFATSAFITKTEDDTCFFPKSEPLEEYYSKNTIGLTRLETTKDINYITVENSDDNTLELEGLSLKDAWVALNGEPQYENAQVSNAEARGEVEFVQPLFSLSEYSYSGIAGSFDSNFKRPSSKVVDGVTVYTHKLAFKTPQLTNMWKYLQKEGIENIDDQINLKIKSLSFIAKGNLSHMRIVGGNNEELKPLCYKVADDIYYIVYNLANNGIDILINPDIAKSNSYTVELDLEFADETLLASYNTDIKFDAKYTLGHTPYDTSSYKYIPNISRKVFYHFAWKEEDNSEIIHEVPSSYTFGYLKETDAWLNAKSPALIMNEWSENSEFIPADDMTAADVYAYMLSNVDKHEFPAIFKTYEYVRKEDIQNSAYIPKVYSINSYAIKDGNLVSSYKSLEEIYTDVNGEEKKAYDKVPEVYKRTRIITIDEDKLWHNFNEVTSADIVIKNIDEENGKADILIFLAFRTKLIIFKTNYYFKDEDKNFTDSEIQLTEEFKDFIVNLEPGSEGIQEYIEISHIDPADNKSLEFLSLNCIKIHNNTMYLVDNKLDMVLRYDIDYLVSEIESENNAFTLSSIKLLDVLQGSGISTDKIYFNNPYSIAISDEHVVIADRGNHCVKIYTPSLNFVKVIKNGPFSKYDVQAVAINPYPCNINDTQIKANSIWIASAQGTSIFLTILEDDIVKVHGRIEDINLLQNDYSWVEEVRGIVFSETHSNYFYLNTTKRVYKFHVSKPFSPYASLGYFKQRALVGAMRWNSLRWPWHNLPYVYAQSETDSKLNVYTTLKWDYSSPSSALELLDNKCFCLTSSPKFKGDIIFHFGLLYNESKVHEYIKEHKDEFGGSMTFYDITPGALADMITSCAILLYRESDSYISSLANEKIRIHDTDEIEKNIENDYINALTFNKLIHSLVCNLLKIKNSLVGRFRAATSVDNIIAFDNLVLDDYFNNLKTSHSDDYFIHDNEAMSIVVNRTFENILDLQEKILMKMQTEFMAAQSFINNASRLI